MFDTIIVPMDGSEVSEQILPYAAALAQPMKIPMELLYAVDPSSQSTEDRTAHPVFVEQIVDRHRGWAQVYLRDVARRMAAEDLETRVRVEFGTPEDEIVKAAGSEGRHLVAMATHGRRGIGRLMLGSVAGEVLRAGSGPLLLYKPGHGLPARVASIRTIIVPLDRSDLGESVLPVAQYLARALKTRIVLARVVPIYPYAMAGGPMAANAHYELLTISEEESRTYLAGRERRLQEAGFDTGTAFLEGKPGSELATLASSTPDSLVVMSTHGRSGLGRMFLGSVADEVIRRGGAPVLLYRAGSSGTPFTRFPGYSQEAGPRSK